ncbi:unnamed protein product [Caenorhabditis angaria]|uniref:BTB domain-containing protein n=1 Tax=Caenorhabditis angaria TaxID=860376 RepID=A0A9P1I490_9PELO|nr:unnamed protein product [Caenorhabditis angaria]
MSSSPKRSKFEDSENAFYSNPVIIKELVLKHKFENLNGWNGKLKYSDCLERDNFKWKIGIRRIKQVSDENTGVYNVNISAFEVHLELIQSCIFGNAWLSKIDGCYKLLKQDGTSDHLSFNFSPRTCFHQTFRKNITNLFGDWSDLKNEGYLKDNSIEIEAHFDFSFYDFNRKIPNFTNIQIATEDNTIYHFNKEVLCSHSKFFFDLLTVNNLETPLLNLRVGEHFKLGHFLATMCPVPLEIREENHSFLKKIANNFDVPSLKHKCDEFSRKQLKRVEVASIRKKSNVIPFQPNPIVKNGNILRWDIENMNEWDGNVRYSDIIYTDDIGWKVGMTRENDKIKIDMILVSVSDMVDGKEWLLKTDGQIKLLSNETVKYQIHEINSSKCFNFEMLTYSSANFTMWDFNEYEGSNTSMTIEIGFRYTFYDFTSRISNTSNITLIVKDCVFHFNKEVLCMNSMFFYYKFYRDNIDKSSFEIENIEPFIFSQFLATMCSISLPITAENVQCLSELAILFEVPSLHTKCDEFLMKYYEINIPFTILYAQASNNETLMRKCLETFQSSEDLKVLKNSETFEKLENKTKICIFNSLMEKI